MDEGGCDLTIQIRSHLSTLGLERHLVHRRNGNRGKDADDGNNDHQLDQGESSLLHRAPFCASFEFLRRTQGLHPHNCPFLPQSDTTSDNGPS